MAKSPYTGYSTHFSERYKNTRIGKCTDKRGDTCCPKCGETRRLDFDDEQVQLGFRYNKYQEFMHCCNPDCGYRFCIVAIRKEDYHGE